MHTILILGANPKDTSRLRLDQEVREIEEGLLRARRRDDFELKTIGATRLRDLRRALLEKNPTFVHFCGHGQGEQGLVFEDDAGKTQLASAEALAGLFESFAAQVRCVVLNACYSRVQAEAIAQQIDYVVGMPTAAKDQSAIEFATAFYDALGAGTSVYRAYQIGCQAVRLVGVAEEDLPILIKKRKIATVFLAHAQEDAPLTEQLANALGRRGIMSLLYVNHLPAGTTLVDQLKSATRRQIVLMPVLSKQVGTPTADSADIRELAFALKQDTRYTRWVYPVQKDPPIDVETVAQTVTQAIYGLLDFKAAANVNVVVDVRGDPGTFRKDPYDFPNVPEWEDDLETLATYPTLVFRPDLGERSRTQLFIGEPWRQLTQTMIGSLTAALGNLHDKPHCIRILGDYQLGLAFLLGQRFDRGTGVTLYAYNNQWKTRFDNLEQDLSGGNAHCERTAETEHDPIFPPKIQAGGSYSSIGLYIGKLEFFQEARKHAHAEHPDWPFVVVEGYSRQNPLTATNVPSLLRDILALVSRLKNQHETRHLRLYCDLPNNVLPLLSAQLTWKEMDAVEFMERNPHAQTAADRYVALPML